MIKKIYVGLNDNYHDPSICIIDDQGNILFAEGIERFLQYKRGHGCPADLDVYIEGVFEKLKLNKVEVIQIASSWSKFHYYSIMVAANKFTYKILKYFFNSPMLKYSVARKSASLTQSGAGLFYHFKSTNLKNALLKTRCNHHLSHLNNAINSRQFIGNSIGVVIDGKGDFKSISIYSISPEVKRIKKINSNFSFGELYGAFTSLAGFSELKGEEWKMMGMSSYHVAPSESIEYIKLRLGSIRKPNKKKKYQDKILCFLKQKTATNQEIASLGQALFEDYFFQLIHWAKELLPNHENIIVCGGSALNSLAIGKLHESGLFKKVIVPNAPADDGNSIGAAFLAYQKDHPTFNIAQKNREARSPYLGNEISESDLLNYVEKSGLPFKKIENPTKYAAELLHQNKIIGWIQGRAEFGPRALGNRSILANPCFAENKDRINAVVKFRESFRPFAPSILHEFGEAYFSKYDFTPYMEKTLTFREEVRNKVPAVVHVDGTGRLQSVTTEINPKFHALISEFYALSGVPIVVNTSYNVMGKPIVNDINDVMAVFLNSQLDAVIIHDYVLERPFHFV